MFMIANERNVVRVPKEAPLELLGPLGCGIQTGAGAVDDALKVRPWREFCGVRRGRGRLERGDGGARRRRTKSSGRCGAAGWRSRGIRRDAQVDAAKGDAVAAVKEITGGGGHSA